MKTLYGAVIMTACVAVAACGGKEAPKTPLARPKPPESQLIGEAKNALDSANVLFRAKSFDRALEQYERASELAPAETAPLLGILMVADVTRDAKLSESTLTRLRKLDPSLADSSAVTPHSRMMREHPKVPPPASG